MKERSPLTPSSTHCIDSFEDKWEHGFLQIFLIKLVNRSSTQVYCLKICNTKIPRFSSSAFVFSIDLWSPSQSFRQRGHPNCAASHAMVGVSQPICAQLAGSEPPPPEAPSASAPLSNLHLHQCEDVVKFSNEILWFDVFNTIDCCRPCYPLMSMCAVMLLLIWNHCNGM